MGDFYQNGIVTTLHNLTDRPLEELEKDLIKFSKSRPMSLILPSLYSELETHAMPLIVGHLQSVKYLSQIVVGLDMATEDQYRKSLKFLLTCLRSIGSFGTMGLDFWP